MREQRAAANADDGAATTKAAVEAAAATTDEVATLKADEEEAAAAAEAAKGAATLKADEEEPTALKLAQEKVLGGAKAAEGTAVDEVCYRNCRLFVGANVGVYLLAVFIVGLLFCRGCLIHTVASWFLVHYNLCWTARQAHQGSCTERCAATMSLFITYIPSRLAMCRRCRLVVQVIDIKLISPTHDR